MNAAAMLSLLRRWRDAGWLRPLDVALAELLHELDAATPPGLLLASALLAQLEGQGHSCLPLAELAADPAALLAWPTEAAPALSEALVSWPGDAAQAWAGASVLQIDPADASGASPLVLQGGRLYLRRHWRSETQVAQQVLARAQPVAGTVFDTAGAHALLQSLFPTSTEQPDWQQVACALALRGRLTLVTGGPGTGKTHTAARALVLLQALHTGPQALRVALAAPTGKAAARLRQAIQQALQGLRATLGEQLPLDDWAAQLGPARTLHALLGSRPGTRRFQHDAANPLAMDVLFVDEASMVHLEMMAALLAALPPGARVLLMGDKDQLASVEAGAVMGPLCAARPAYSADTAAWVRQLSGQMLASEVSGATDALAQQTVVLRHSHRFAGPIGQLAQALNQGEGAVAAALLRSAPQGQIQWLEAPVSAVPGLVLASTTDSYRGYLELLTQRPLEAADFEPWARRLLAAFDRFRVLCALREGPWGVTGLNAAIERALLDAGLLQRRGEWYEGRPVMVTRNEPALGVFNGDIGLVLRPPRAEGGPRVYFAEGEQLRSVASSRLPDVETAFAMTVHKSQGSEFAHVLLVLPDEDNPVLTRELLYTGVTRSRERFTLLARHAGPLLQACARPTRRLSGLRALLGRAAGPGHSNA